MNVRTVRVLKILDSVMILLGLVGFTIFGIVKFFRPMASWHRADFFAQDLCTYCQKFGDMPQSIEAFCAFALKEKHVGHCKKEQSSYVGFIFSNYVVNYVSLCDLKRGQDFVIDKVGRDGTAEVVNSRLRFYLNLNDVKPCRGSEDEKELRISKVFESRLPLSAADKKSQIAGEAVSQELRMRLSSQLNEKSEAERARMASDKNQLMDALLNQPEIPSDYGETMVSLCRDRSQDVLTRDFAVQHIGLYAQALNRRGVYNAKSAEAMSLRDALFDAAGETRTIVAAAAFRALADMAAFDPQIDPRRLDSTLAACVGNESAAPAARSMAVQLCGERRVRSARPALERIIASPDSPEILRRGASRALARLR